MILFTKVIFNVPDRWERTTNRIAATLENADNEFERTIRGIDNYRTYFGAYMSREQRESELATLRTVFEFDLKNMKLAHQIARMAISLEKWKVAENSLKIFIVAWEKSENGIWLEKALKQKTLSQFLTEIDSTNSEMKSFKDPVNAAILLDFGWAQWQQKKMSGRKYIQWAVALDPENVDARIALAKAYAADKQNDKTLECFEAAFRTDPSDPRALSGFMLCKIAEEKDLNFISMVRPSIESCIETCMDRAETGVYLPEAFYDIGFFAMLLGRPYESLMAMAKAVIHSSTAFLIDETFARIEAFENALKKGVADQYDVKIKWIKLFLAAASFAKLLDISRSLKEKKEIIEAEIFFFIGQDTFW